MVLVDRITEFNADRSIETAKAVAGSEPCYQAMADDLPPERYAYPRSMILELFGQSAALLWLGSHGGPDAAGGGLPMVCWLRNCRFTGSAFPASESCTAYASTGWWTTTRSCPGVEPRRRPCRPHRRIADRRGTPVVRRGRRAAVSTTAATPPHVARETHGSKEVGVPLTPPASSGSRRSRASWSGRRLEHSVHGEAASAHPRHEVFRLQQPGLNWSASATEIPASAALLSRVNSASSASASVRKKYLASRSSIQ